mmetsp:Transcript_102123/g.243553  ORF Transcript_102123/g.243553 Transcript_102123/m.243553 type:complete len:101 (+) Transcript_102123:345-647(+)
MERCGLNAPIPLELEQFKVMSGTSQVRLDQIRPGQGRAMAMEVLSIEKAMFRFLPPMHCLPVALPVWEETLTEAIGRRHAQQSQLEVAVPSSTGLRTETN